MPADPDPRSVPSSREVPTTPPLTPSPAAGPPEAEGRTVDTTPPGFPVEVPTTPPIDATPPAEGGHPPEVPGYQIERELGRGAWGVVYRARQVKANRTVALKMILSGQHAGPEEMKRFRTEAEAIARLQHPGIVQVFEVGEHQGLPFFSLELCPAGSLAEYLAGTPLEPPDAAGLVRDLAGAMEAAHREQVVHRDLKPHNVLLAPRPGAPAGASATGRGDEDRPPLSSLVAKVTDFGLAKKLDEATRTQTGAVMGTPSYMAPEQARGEKEVGPSADVYALGAILYECLTGRPPFKAATTLETIFQVISQEPVAPGQLNPQVPCDLETICLKCLSKETGKRYGSAAALAEDLGRYLRGEPIAARPVGRLERGWRWCRRNPSLAAALGGVAASLVLGTVVASVLAVQADNARDEAEQRATAEADAKEEAVAARNELARSNDRLLSSVARSLVRPLGLQVQPDQPLPPLSDPEIEALEELGQTEEEKLRLRFAEEAIRTPVTTRQLRYRAAYALQAAVGLDVSRRQAVERILVKRLSAKGILPEEGTDLSLCLVELGGTGPQTSGKAALALTRAMAETRNVLRRESLSRGLGSVAARLESREAKEVALALTRAMTETTEPLALRFLSEGLVSVVLYREPMDRRKERLGSVTGALGLSTSPVSFLGSPALLGRALQPVPDPLPPQILVELLKAPLCVGEARHVVLEVLGARYGRAFADQWDFVRFATENDLGLDLTTPPKVRPGLTRQ
jgi:serine/threonine protein kinase